MLVACLALFLPMRARSEVLDRIEVRKVGGNAEIQVRFGVRVQYLRHFPQKQGDTLRVYIALVPTNGVIPEAVREQRRSPPGNLVPRFTVSFPDQGGSLLIKFDKPVQFKVGPGSDSRSIRVVVPLEVPQARQDGAKAPAAGIALGAPAVPSPAAKAPVVVPPPQQPVVPAAQPGEPSPAPAAGVEADAARLMSQARAALDADDVPAAVDALNRLLNLPPNRFSQEAQELAGLARERNGEVAKARAEYELYLKLYPEGEGAQRVRARLTALGEPPKTGAREAPPVQPATGAQKMIYGSLSQYYYRGASKIDTAAKPPQLPNSQTLSMTDQSALISSLDLTGRVRGEHSDTRLVLRDTHTADFLPGADDENRLFAAYVEHDQKGLGLMVRAGRQSPPTGGVIERFDGGYARKSVGSHLRVFGLAGVPAELDLDSSRRFYQGGVELGREGGAWGATLYGFGQTVDDIADRQTIGGEARYYSNGASLYSLLDYDVLFGTLNILLAQANWQSPRGTSLNLIADRRKTPTIQTTNALMGETSTSIQALLDTGLTAQDLRDGADAVTADSTLLLLGLTQTVNARWQLGGDVRLTRISATEGSSLLPPAPSTGNIFTYTLQATATGLFGGDVNVLSVGLIDAPTYRGPLVLLSNSTLRGRWRFEPALRYYQQTDDTQTRTTRVNPSLRATYRLKDSISLEAEAGYELTDTDTVLTTDKVRRHYFALGYRWDFY
jgi:tetratricopeptide (TPR) repeat protein